MEMAKMTLVNEAVFNCYEYKLINLQKLFVKEEEGYKIFSFLTLFFLCLITIKTTGKMKLCV